MSTYNKDIAKRAAQDFIAAKTYRTINSELLEIDGVEPNNQESHVVDGLVALAHRGVLEASVRPYIDDMLKNTESRTLVELAGDFGGDFASRVVVESIIGRALPSSDEIMTVLYDSLGVQTVNQGVKYLL